MKLNLDDVEEQVNRWDFSSNTGEIKLFTLTLLSYCRELESCYGITLKMAHNFNDELNRNQGKLLVLIEKETKLFRQGILLGVFGTVLLFGIILI